MRLAIIGSRTFNDYDRLKKNIDTLDHMFVISGIVSGGAKGADSLAERYAKENYIPMTVFKPDWNTHGKSAGFIRNKTIIDNCDAVIAFWDEKSKGTAHSIELARKAEKLVRVVKFG